MPHIRSLLIAALTGLLSALFGIILSAQVLGFIGAYTPISAILSAGLIALFAGVAFYRTAHPWHQQLMQTIKPLSWLDWLMIAVAILVVVIVFWQRFARWPDSTLGANFPTDFSTYHAIKALDLVRSGSFWNLAIPYGQYPIGYEGLLAFVYSVTGLLGATGIIHGLVLVFIWITMSLLIVRYTTLSDSIAIWLSLLICLVPAIYSSLLIVGKNDTLITATILCAILFAPIGNRESNFHLYGLACITMVSLATKLTGLYVLVFLWAWVMWLWWQSYRKGDAYHFMTVPQFAIAIAIMFPCGLWVIRNLLVMGEVLTSEIRSFFQTSIFANISNPLLYQSGAESEALILVSVLFIVLMVATIRWLGWAGFFLFGVIAVGFVTTPLSAFHTPDSMILHIEWRYALYGICFALVVCIVMLQRWINRVFAWLIDYRLGRIGVAMGVLAFLPLIHLGLGTESLYGTTDTLADLLLVECRTPFETVYDYVRCEIESGSIYSEGVNWLLLTYPNPDLIIHSGNLYPLGRPDIYQFPAPDYAVTASATPTFDTLAETYTWELLYRDDSGSVFRRIP